MNLSNVFYFKDIVDSVYPDENRAAVDIQAIVNELRESIQELSDDDFSEVIISCFIPDLYSGMGKKEKLFTKLTELMVGEWWRRMGGDYNLPTKKSGTEDVELIFNNSVHIVCDAKVFRLGRSQKAPNVKDFLKLASVQLWIKNLEKRYEDESETHHVLGGLVTYSSLHEWESDSEVYEECTNLSTPVLMLPYEVLAFLLSYKDCFDLTDFIKIWDYRENGVRTSRQKAGYWNYVENFICNMLDMPVDDYREEMKEYHARILAAAQEYRKIVQSSIDTIIEYVSRELDKQENFERLKAYALNEIVKRDNSTALDYLKHIDDFRYYRDQDD